MSNRLLSLLCCQHQHQHQHQHQRVCECERPCGCDLECVCDCVCVGRILVSILDPLEEMSYVISLLLDLIVTTKIQKTNNTQ